MTGISGAVRRRLAADPALSSCLDRKVVDAHHRRLLSRSRATRQHGLTALVTRAMDPVTLVMERKMLLTIKDPAERSHR